MRESKAYHFSIYLMLVMPAALVSGTGLYLYWGLRKSRLQREANGWSLPGA